MGKEQGHELGVIRVRGGREGLTGVRGVESAKLVEFPEISRFRVVLVGWALDDLAAEVLGLIQCVCISKRALRTSEH